MTATQKCIVRLEGSGSTNSEGLAYSIYDAYLRFDEKGKYLNTLRRSDAKVFDSENEAKEAFSEYKKDVWHLRFAGFEIENI